MSTADISEHQPRWPDRETQVAPHAGESRGNEPAREPPALELRTLFDEHYAAVWRLLRRFGVAPLNLDDAAQEVFWVAARRLADVRRGSERSFLYGVALRIASDHARRRRSVAKIADDPDELLGVVDPSPTPERRLEERQARELLDWVLDQMPLDLRTVLVLAELEELEVGHIAEIEGIPLGTASSRLRRAREEFAAISKRLRAALASRGARL